MIKDVLKLLLVISLSLFFVILTSFMQVYWVHGELSSVIIEEVVKLIPILIFARTILGCGVFGTASGLTYGVIEALMANIKYGSYAPSTILLHVFTAVLLGLIGVYPYKKNKFLFFMIPVALTITVLIHYYFNIFGGDIGMALSSIFYL